MLQSSRLNGVVRWVAGRRSGHGLHSPGRPLQQGRDRAHIGAGRQFPQGIPLGQVTEIRQRDIDVFQQAVVQPTVDFGSLELVMVVTNFDPLENLARSAGAGGRTGVVVPTGEPGTEDVSGRCGLRKAQQATVRWRVTRPRPHRTAACRERRPARYADAGHEGLR
ncbi:MAG: rod shape-determining protein MreC [Caldilineaceae bacterium]